MIENCDEWLAKGIVVATASCSTGFVAVFIGAQAGLARHVARMTYWFTVGLMVNISVPVVLNQPLDSDYAFLIWLVTIAGMLHTYKTDR